MAQVKKFQTPAGPIEGTAASNPAGTPAEVKKKYGRWIRDGIAYEMDDEKIEDLRRHIAAMKPELQPYAAEEYKRVLNGKDATINTMLNQREGVEDYAVLTDKQEKRLQNGKTKEGILNSLFNTPTHKFNVATYELGKWDPSKNTTSKTTETKKTKLTKRTGSFAYDLTDKNVQRYKDYHNQDEMQYLKDIFNYLDETNRDQFDATGFDGIADIESVYKQKGGKEWAKTLIDNILAGRKIDGEYKDFLDVIGLSQSFGTNPEIIQQKIDDEVATKKNTDWTNSGYAGAWSTKDRDKYFTHNADGTFTFKGSLPSNINLSTGNYYFNDEFVEENPMYDYLSGKINYDNKWYSDKDLLNPESLLYKTLAAKDYFNMNKRGEYGNANNILKSSWKGQENLIPAWGEGTEEYLGDFYGKRFLYENRNYNMPDTKIRIQTGLDESGAPIYVEKDINDNWVIRRGVDLSSTNFLPDGTGRRPWAWKITDAYGNEINDIDGISIKNKPLTYDDFIGLYDGSTVLADQSIPTPRTRITDDQYSPYYNRYADANDFGFTAYRTKDNDTVHVSIPTNIGGIEGQIYADMPISVYDVISNRSFVKSILNSDISTKFFKLIREKKDKIGAATLATYLPKINGEYNLELAQKIIEYFKNRKTIGSPESFKKGGVIKAQTGTVVKNLEHTDSQKTLDNAKTLNELYKNPYAPQSVREDGKWRDENFRKSVSAALGETDAAELWGLGLDAAGFIGGMIPGLGDLANVALSTIGANIAYGIADRRKVKAGAAPKFTTVKNIAKNTAFDAASILPVVGDAANGANWATRLIYFLKRSKPALEWIKASIGAIGVYGGVAALDKIISGEDLTTDDIKALMYGVMAATGLIRQGAHNFNESRLAAKSHPGVEQIPYKTKYKTTENGVEVEKDVVFTADDIAKAIALGNRGDTKSKAELAKLIKEKAPGISDEEVNRIMGSSNALRELGLVRDTPWYRRNGYVEAKPEKAPKPGGYFLKPGERQKALIERTPSQIAEAATSDRNMGKVGAEWIRAKGQGVPEGYLMSDNTFWQRGSVSKSNSGTEQQNRGANSAQNNQQSNPAQQPGSTNQPVVPSVETPTNRAAASEPVITPEAPTRNFSSEEFNAKFEQYAKVLGAKYSKKHKKSQFERRIDMLSKDPDFKKWVQDDPDFAKELIDSETKRAAQMINKPEAQLRAEVTRKLGFKKGGIIKAANGQWFRNIGENIKTGLEKLNDPSMQNLRDNTVRFASGYFYNRKSANDQIQAGRDSLRYLQPRKLTEYYMPNVINAGDAEKQFAQSQFQYRPAVTNDPNSYQAWKKEAYDKGNLSLANATRQYSQQDVDNGLQWVTDRRNYANAEAAGMTEFGKTVAAWKNTEAGIRDIQNRATAESFIQAIGERQKQRDVDIAAINAANKAYTDYDNELFKQSELQKAMDTYFTKDNKYDPTNPAHEKWIRDKKEEITRTYLNRGWKTTYDGLTSQQQRMYDKKYGKPAFKSGGKMRSTSDLIAINREKASDQIRVNKAKSQDKIWENNLKDARKALDKMSDRVHDILMKLLS